MDLQQIASMSAFLKQELQPLAEKLGQTAAFTYSIFMRQVWVSALSDLLWVVPGTILLSFVKKLWNYGIKRKAESSWDMDGDMAFIGSALCLVIGLIMVLVPVSEIIQAAINPDYAAIKLIFETVKTTVGK